ncbi:haloacid dehalogenase hydrolase, putative [Trypanosoma equiperdum]|uniref:Haloacid dehalogenase hydrolase, putative n=2 Tax=Trypanozoon TaxID=39700 RepID=Q384S8_TRYB2|nr:haloacid dehalogenase hydrolase, putative [Trypanosoma brucei brucei TREU927]EAN79703.1 haloacid dehalogenase hydrolase, putative [Trypanosoma brucei brucei TREU927]SCU70845.1 haloacid dehalogenase hydrolase, putative [Trypanosoma equiperdum]
MPQCGTEKHVSAPPSYTGPFVAVVVDLDGTILDDNHRVSDVTKATLYEVASCGVHIIIATGRPREGVAAIEQELNSYFRCNSRVPGRATSLAEVKGFHLVASNGARIYNTTGELISAESIDNSVVRAIYERVTESNINANSEDSMLVSVHQTGAWWVNNVLPEEWLRRKYGTLPEVRQNLSDFPTDGVGKICLRSFNEGTLRTFQKELDTKYEHYITTVMTSDHCLDIMPKGVSKASALRMVGEILNFEPHRDAIAFGDSLNDRDMLESVAKGCIMKNGKNELKELLPHVEVVGCNEEDGVAHKLREVFLLS